MRRRIQVIPNGLIKLVGVMLVALPPPVGSSEQPPVYEVRIWLRSFIPNKHPGVPNFFKQTTHGTYVLDAPSLSVPVLEIGKLSGTCFETDNRGFSLEENASSRVSAVLSLKISGRNISFQGVPARSIGSTKNVDCVSGAELQGSRTADVSTVVVGDVKGGGWLRVINVRASTKNPFYAVAGVGVAPAIDFEAVVQYDVLGRKIKVHGAAGHFPAFEVIASINGGAPKSVARTGIYGKSTALSLSDLAMGINTQNFSGEFPLN